MEKYTFTNITGDYDYVHEFHEGLAFVRNNFKEFKVGYIDKTGKVVIPLDYYGRVEKIIGKPEYADYVDFKNGIVSLMNKDGKYGVIDKTNKVIIPFEYGRISLSGKGFICASKDGKFGKLNLKNEFIEISVDDFTLLSSENELIGLMKNGKHGYVDKNGKIIIPFEYDNDFHNVDQRLSEGLIAVSKDGKKGYINKSGEVVIPLGLEYETIGRFYEGIAMVSTGKNIGSPVLKNENEKECHERIRKIQNNKRYGFIDKKGEIVIPLEYTSILGFGFNKGLILAEKNDKYSFINNLGETIMSLDYDFIDSYKNGYALVKKDGKWGMIDQTGNLIIPLLYEDIYHFNEGFSSVKKDGKWGFVNTDGNIAIPFEYDSVGRFSEGLCIVKKDGKWGIIQN